LAAVDKSRAYGRQLLDKPFKIGRVLSPDYPKFATLEKFVGPLDPEILLKAPFKRIGFAAPGSYLRKYVGSRVSILVRSKSGSSASQVFPFADNGCYAFRSDAADLSFETELKPAHTLDALVQHGPFEF
jgi:hypothetical protein